MIRTQILLLLSGFALVAACSEKLPPRTVSEFLDDPMLLEAAVVRCSHNRDESRYDAECVNARQAVAIIEAKEERVRHKALEEQSTRKREALRRTQEAAAEARRRSAEQDRLRREAAYLAQFGEMPPPADGDTAVESGSDNAPEMDLPEPHTDEQGPPGASGSTPATDDGGNAPAVEAEPASDLNAIREELRQRNAESGN